MQKRPFDIPIKRILGMDGSRLGERFGLVGNEVIAYNPLMVEV